MAQDNRTPPNRAGRTTAQQTGTGRFETRQVKVRSHSRRTASGRQTTVRSHTRTISAWKQAGIAWAGAGAAGLTTLGLVLETTFVAISTIMLILTMLLGAVAAWATARATKPRRRMRAKVRRRPRARSRSTATRRR